MLEKQAPTQRGLRVGMLLVMPLTLLWPASAFAQPDGSVQPGSACKGTSKMNRRQRSSTWLGIVAVLVLVTNAAAAIINVPGDQPTIQAGINAAVNGDDVVVAIGTYNENINFNGKAITVRSTDPNDAGVVLNTIINGGGHPNAPGTS